jgi:hypothetical protein
MNVSLRSCGESTVEEDLLDAGRDVDKRVAVETLSGLTED